jgi:SH3 domain protein
MKIKLLTKYRTLFMFMIVLSVSLDTAPALAETQYVSDVLIISIKDDRTPDAAAVGYLRSATPVDVLEETEDHMQIRTSGGVEGWVKKKFIVAEKPKAVIIKELEEKISLLESDIKTLQDGSDSQDLETKISGFKQEIASLTDTLKKESMLRLALQKDLKQINAKYQELSKKNKDNASISKELTSLKNENKALKEKIASQPVIDSPSILSGNMKWFLIGGGVLLLGFLIGRSIKGKRSHKY